MADPTETEWQAMVVTLLHALGWRHLHVRRSIGKHRRWVTATNRDGWPDLFAWHPKRGFVAIELKVGRNVASREQLEVLAELEDAGARTMVAWPRDLEVLQALLSGPHPANGSPLRSAASDDPRRLAP